MRLFLTITLFFTSLVCSAQNDTVSLQNVLSRLDRALLAKDQQTLQAVLHKDLSFGHSNGWVQNKHDVINDLQNGKLVYNRIENSSVMIIAISKKWATVRANVNAEGVLNGNTFQLKLHTLQVWIKTKKGWELLARQSAKL